MDSDSDSQSDYPEESSISPTHPMPAIPPIEAIWDCIKDPIEDQIIAQIAAQIERQQEGTSTQHQCFSRRYIVRDREAGRQRLIGDYFCNDDIHRLLQVGEARGFPGMLGSLDCMHWQWKNCPVAWKGQFTRGDYKKATVILEAVASHDLWIWHAFFGAAGSNNDINVLNQSTLFTEVLQGRAPEVQFMVNGNQYNMGYYLTDGIYPEWATFVKSVPRPLSAKDKLFADKQAGVRKDVECAFGVLQARFAIIRNPARMWEREALSQIMYACIILHNMIVEDERDSYGKRNDYDYDQTNSAALVNYYHGPINEFARMLEINTAIHNRSKHCSLKADLTEHIWQRFGSNQDQDTD